MGQKEGDIRVVIANAKGDVLWSWSYREMLAGATEYAEGEDLPPDRLKEIAYDELCDDFTAILKAEVRNLS